MKKIIVGNWKMMPPTLPEAKRLFEGVKKGIKPKAKSRAEVVICPPFVYLSELVASASVLQRRDFAFGSQDCFWKDKGAFTGEISPSMLKNLGAKYVILGHSERRESLGETDEMVNKKVLAALRQNLKVILCVGEKQREEFVLPAVVKLELTRGLKGASQKSAKNIIIAYEPVWAIGTGKTDTPEDLFEMAIYIRKILLEIFGKNSGYEIPILYGGSFNSKNANKFLEVRGVSGLLVGGASLEPKEFSQIVNSAQ